MDARRAAPRARARAYARCAAPRALTRAYACARVLTRSYARRAAPRVRSRHELATCKARQSMESSKKKTPGPSGKRKRHHRKSATVSGKDPKVVLLLVCVNHSVALGLWPCRVVVSYSSL